MDSKMKRYGCFLSKSQHGGMLVELMMSVAIAAILIPFIFRYQQNAVERARNIAIARQMEIVQAALERYILRNRNDILYQSGTISLCLEDLAGYGLSDEFIQEHGCNQGANDYGLRILKYGNQSNKPVIQGVVLLNNSDIKPLRTRQVANFGGGKVGYVDGDQVYGGFNVFKGPKTNFGLNSSDITSGVVGTTKTLRNSAIYLWRLGSDTTDGPDNATMLSPLNLNGKNVKNVGFVSVNHVKFDDELYTKSDFDSRGNTSFYGATEIKCNNCAGAKTYFSTSAYVYGPIGSYQGKFTTDGTLSVTGTARALNLNIDGLGAPEEDGFWDLTVQNADIGGTSTLNGDNPSLTVGGYLSVSGISCGNDNCGNTYITGNGALTEYLSVASMIYPTNNTGTTIDPSSSDDGSDPDLDDGRGTQTGGDTDTGGRFMGPAGKIRSGSMRGGTRGQTITGGSKGGGTEEDGGGDDDDPEGFGSTVIDDPSVHVSDPDNPGSEYLVLGRTEICCIDATDGPCYTHCWNANYRDDNNRIYQAAVLYDVEIDHLKDMLIYFHCREKKEHNTKSNHGHYIYDYTKGQLASEAAFDTILGKSCNQGGKLTVGDALKALDYLKKEVVGKYVEWYVSHH